MKKDNTQYYIYGGIALLAYFGIFRPILKKVGIATGEEKNKVNNAETAPADSNPFNPKYYKTVQSKNPGKTIVLKTQAGLERIYKKFYDGFGYVYDDEEQIQSCFIELASKVQVSQFAEIVQKKTGYDIITFMKRGINSYNAGSGLNDTEIARIIDIVNAKPIYTKP